MPKSYYEILDVKPDASDGEIRRAYRKKIREFHPDLNPEKARADKRSRELNIALEVLTDPAKRKRYDEQLERMGKAKANKEFETEANTTEGDAKESFDFEPKGNETGPKRRQKKSTKRLQPIWLLLSIVTAGFAAVCVSMVFLWVFFRLDPTGLLAAEPQQLPSEKGYMQEMLDGEELKALHSELKNLHSRIDALASTNGPELDSPVNLAHQKSVLKSHYSIQGVDGPDSSEPIELSIKPPRGRHIIFSTIVAFSEEPMSRTFVLRSGLTVLLFHLVSSSPLTKQIETSER